MKKALLSLSAFITITAVNAQTVQRVPLFEVFTSSTCPPCKPGNAVYHNVVNSKPTGEYVSIKFQQDFPGSGDPYATTEGVSRRSYYAINSIPRMEIDGGWDENAQSFTDGLYTQYRSVAANATLTGTYSVSSAKVVKAKVKFSAIGAAFPAGTKVYVAIVETRDTANKKNNGETEFFDVMKKMMPTNSGTTVQALTVGQSDSLELTFSFTGSYRLPANGQSANRINHATEHSVENFANLKVVAWIQGSNKSVFQAANLTKLNTTAISNVSNTVGEVMVFPNPASNNVNINIAMKNADNVTAVIYGLNGTAVASKTATLSAGAGQISFDVQNIAAGLYNLVIFDSKNNSFSERISVAH